MWRIIRSSVRGHARRLVSTSVAICLGVALLAGTLVLGDTLEGNFDRLFQSALGTPDAVVRSANTLDTDGEFTQDLIDGSLADSIAALDGVGLAEHRLEQRVEVGLQGVAEHERAGEEGDAEAHRDRRADEAADVGAQRRENEAQHVRLRSS